MSPELHRRVRGIFDQVLERPESERRQFLKEICGADDETFQAVERLLEAHDETSFFLDGTAPGARRFGRYVISRELGRGAMGVVYEAADPLIGRAVAVKVIRLQPLSQPDHAGFLRERLFREARSAGGLSHPGIVTIFDVGFEDDVAFIAMERVNGPSLQQRLASSPRLDNGKALDILRQTALALDYAHRHGVIHRDVKPANIMLHEGTAVKITDFGIAKIVSTEMQTRTGMVMGTPSHMSPEQIEAKTLNGRSDQFSLATVAFYMLTGTEAFQAESLAPLLHKILHGQRPSARALNSALPPGIDTVFERGLEKDPEARYETCAEFVRALEKAFDVVETLTAVMEPPKPVVAEKTGGKRWKKALGGIAAATLVAGVALAYFSGISPPWRRITAESRLPGIEASKIAASKIDAPKAEASRNEPSPAPPPVAVEIKPSPLTPLSLRSTEPEPPPPATDSKSARARQFYDQAVKYRKANQQAKAIDLFNQAANLGDVRAMVELGETYMNDSDAGPADFPEALRWLRKAAEAGSSAGMVDLGGMYLLGNGVEEDFETAAQWFRKAAAAGNPAAMYDLGTMYENAQGVVEDREKATQLYKQAAGLGNRDARRRLDELAQ